MTTPSECQFAALSFFFFSLTLLSYHRLLATFLTGNRPPTIPIIEHHHHSFTITRLNNRLIERILFNLCSTWINALKMHNRVSVRLCVFSSKRLSDSVNPSQRELPICSAGTFFFFRQIESKNFGSCRLTYTKCSTVLFIFFLLLLVVLPKRTTN